VQQRLQQALSDWQQWKTPFPLVNQPTVVRELPGGLTNTTFLVAADNLQAVVRINSADSKKLGINRQREGEILRRLQPTGLVPEVYYNDQQILVSEFIEGTVLNDRSLQNVEVKQALSVAISQIQSVKMFGVEPRNYLQYCRDYIQQLPDKALSPAVIETVEAVALEVDNEDWEPVICHHDLVPENIIINDRAVFIIDWEYAALGHPELDFLMLDSNGVSSSLLELKQAMDTLWLAVRKQGQ